MEGHDALRAAQDTAYWTATGGIAAWIFGFTALFLNAVGGFFLWKQLRASEKAANAAHEAVKIAASETRPWLTLELVDLKGQVNINPTPTVKSTGQINIKNIGKTPATNVVIATQILYHPNHHDINTAFDKLRSTKANSSLLVFPDHNEFSYFYARTPFPSSMIGRHSDVKLAAIALYHSGVSNHETLILFDLWPDDDFGELVGWHMASSQEIALVHQVSRAATLTPT